MRPFCRCTLVFAVTVLLQCDVGWSRDSVTEVRNPIANLAVADSGKRIVLQLAGESALRVFDPRQREFVGQIDTQAADAVFGAGGNTVLFYRPGDSTLESWDLQTLQQIESVEFVDPGPILRIVMGRSNGDEALIRATTGSGALDQTALQLLDARTLRPLSRKLTGTTGHNRSYRDFVHYRADRFLTYVSEWCTSHSPSGIGLLVRRGREFETYYEHDSQGYLAMGERGLIYTEKGSVLTNNPNANRISGSQQSLVSRGSIPGVRPIPGTCGTFVLGIDSNDMTYLYEASSKQRIAESGALPDSFWPAAKGKPGRRGNTPNIPVGLWDDANFATVAQRPPGGRPAEQWSSTTFTLDRRIVFSPDLGYVMFVPYSDKSIIVRDVNLKKMIQELEGALYITSAPVTRGESGKEWQYRASAVSSAEDFKISLVKGPEGMELVDGETVHWKIPAGITGSADVVLEAKDASGRVKRQEFTVTFE